MIKRIDKFMENVEKVIIAFGIIFMALVLIVNVILRTFFASSLTFSEEIGQILLMAITFVGMSYVARHGKHIRMSAVYEIVKPKYKKVLAIIISVITSITLFWLSYVAFNYVLSLMASFRVTPALRIPVYLVTFVVVYGYISSAIQYLYISYLNFKKKEIYLGTYQGAEEIDFDSLD